MLHCSVVLQNIRSARKNFDRFLDTLEVEKIYPDIICLTETWIGSHEKNLYNIAGYKMLDNCNDDYKSGGVLIYVNDTFVCDEVTIDFATGDFLGAKITVNNESFTLICIYRFIWKSISLFLGDMDELLKRLKCHNLYIVGDININLMNNYEAEDYVMLMSSYGLDSLVNSPTRISGQTATCLDHIWSRNKKDALINAASVHHLHVTDHSLVTLTIKSNRAPLVRQRVQRTKNVVKYDKLVDFLRGETWGDVFEQDDASVAFDMFLRRFQAHLEASTHRISFSSGAQRHFARRPWVSPSVGRLIKRKNKILNISNDKPNNVRLKIYSRNLSKRVWKITAARRNRYYLNKLRDSRGNMRKTWEIVNELSGRNRAHHCIDSLKDVHGNILADSNSIATEFNSCFARMPADIAAQIVPPNVPYRISSSNPRSIFLSSVTALEVHRVISSLRTTSSSGFDNINGGCLKRVSWYVVDVLAHLINLSFREGIFPEALKFAVVVPIYKKGDKRAAENYRPISLLSIFSKIYEKLMKVRLLGFLKKYSLLPGYQYGFREGRGCEQALESFLGRVAEEMNEDRKVGALFLDVCKAFDTVNHDLLLRKLEAFGIRGIALKWFSTYLSGRRQSVRIGSVLSAAIKLLSGVPQGSILGPILFIIYIHDIHLAGLLGVPTAYADDIAITYSGKSYAEVMQAMNHDINVIKLWFDHHFMLLSQKSNYMLFALRGEPDQSTLKVHQGDCVSRATSDSCSSACYEIDRVSTFKYLGVTLDQNLTWRDHIELVRKHLRVSMWHCYKIRESLPRNVLASFYYSMIQSKLQYGIPFWGAAYDCHLLGVISAQKIILRTMSFKGRFYGSSPLFSSWNIMPLRDLYVYRTMRLFFNRSGNRVLRPQVLHLGRGLREVYLVPRPRKEFYKHTFSYRAPKVANSLCELLNKIDFSFNELKMYLGSHGVNEIFDMYY